MSYDPATDKYEPISWEDAFALVGEHAARSREPAPGVVLHLRAAQQRGDLPLPALGARVRHEQPAGLLEHVPRGQRPGADGGDRHRQGHRRPAATGSSADAIWLMGDNAATNAPRMLTWLAEAERRGAQLIHINPLIEAASRRTIVPHEFVDMATFHTTKIGTMNVQVRIGGDLALLRGVAKAVFEAAEKRPGRARPGVHRTVTPTASTTTAAIVEATPWADLVRAPASPRPTSGTGRLVHGVEARDHRLVPGPDPARARRRYGARDRQRAAPARQHRPRGRRPCPVRGHSNVQGNRTCGIDHRPDAAFLDRLAAVCGIDPPREHGLGTVETIEAMQRGDVKVFVALGGNFALAAPDLPYTAEALRKCELTVQVSTKLNRSHIVHGKRALILPCLARTDKDRQASGEQGITVEDSMSMVHISYGMKEPGSPHQRSECAILARHGPGHPAARARRHGRTTPTTTTGSATRWRGRCEGFEDFNRRARHPHGFRIAQPARERVFKTPSGRAEFSPAPLPDGADPGEGRLLLTTIRSHDQFNTTIYSNDDRYRGLKGLRTVVFMNGDDMRDRGLEEFDLIDITSYSRDGSQRSVYGYRAVLYEIPRGCTAGYMPELNVLCGIADVSTQSEQPVTKHLVVEVVPARSRDR